MAGWRTHAYGGSRMAGMGCTHGRFSCLSGITCLGQRHESSVPDSIIVCLITSWKASSADLSGLCSSKGFRAYEEG